MHDYLSTINSPDDLKQLLPGALPDLAQELRDRIISTVSKNGGHLASNLGAIELTIALLQVFSPPKDKIIFDVSHQAYAYKLLTGRRDAFGTLRKTGGISGFLKREESEYDAFGSGHAGNALSAAIGFAVARDARGSDENVVAVVGDGAISNGISMEAMNNAISTKKVILILNDNEMSISGNVGAFGRYLGNLLASPRYNRLKYSVERTGINTLKMSWFRRHYYRIEAAIKSLFVGNALFETYGLRYIGPIDGHDISRLRNAFEIARDAKGPVVVHVATRKGKGYKLAEDNPAAWHGTPSFDVETGRHHADTKFKSYSAIFGEQLEKLAEGDQRIVAITAAMAGGTGLYGFAEKFPSRFFDVGICEEHQAIFAAGMAASGMRPVVAVYSTFFQRAIDPVIHDIAMQRLPVVFCIDRAGVVPGDGPTHHGVFDIALLRSVPNMVIMQPRDEVELARMLKLALALDGPCVLRYPRNCGAGLEIPDDVPPAELGRSEEISRSEPAPGKARVAIWAMGNFVGNAAATAGILRGRGYGVTVTDARFVRPLDKDALLRQAKEGPAVFASFENGEASGGLGSAMQECLADADCRICVARFGWPDRFMPHASSMDDLLKDAHITPQECADEIERRVAAQG